MRVAVVAEYYPRPSDPAWGIWAHRQALAVREHGVEVRVARARAPAAVPQRRGRAAGPGPLAQWAGRVVDPHGQTVMDGMPGALRPFLSPRRGRWSYATWGRWASARRSGARSITVAARTSCMRITRCPRAMPCCAGSARGNDVPLVVSVHGGDLSYTAARSERGREVVARVLRAADAVIANSEVTRRGIEDLTGPLPFLEVIHPGADVPEAVAEREPDPTLVTVAHLEPHKNQAAVIRAVAALRDRHPALRYVLIGKGPDRDALEQLAARLGRGRPGLLRRAHGPRRRARAHGARLGARDAERPRRVRRGARRGDGRRPALDRRHRAPAPRTSRRRGTGWCSCLRATTACWRGRSTGS